MCLLDAEKEKLLEIERSQDPVFCLELTRYSKVLNHDLPLISTQQIKATQLSHTLVPFHNPP